MTDVRSRNDYYRSYYEGRKDKLSEERRGRYQSDPEYREKAKQSARNYRKQKKAERDQLRASGKLPPSRPKGPRKPVSVSVNGSSVMAHTITVAADRIGVSVNVLNNWSKAGLLPVTPLRSPRGDRLYTADMIFVVRMAFLAREKVSVRDTSFRAEIEVGWRNHGVEINC